MNSIRGLRGFTLIELLISVAIVGILCSIALPAYDAYITKSRVRSSQVDMLSLGLSIESTYQRALSYKAGNYTDASAIRAVYDHWRPAEKHFNYSLAATSSSYVITATGNDGKLKGCVMTIDDKGLRTNNCPGSSPEWN